MPSILNVRQCPQESAPRTMPQTMVAQLPKHTVSASPALTLVGSSGSIARQKAASGQPRIEMVCSACAACELWWGTAGLNGCQGSSLFAHERWGAAAPRCQIRPIRDTLDAQPGRHAKTRHVARTHFPASRLAPCAHRAAHHHHGAADRWLHVHSTGPGPGPCQLCQQPQPPRSDLPSALCSVTVCPLC